MTPPPHTHTHISTDTITTAATEALTLWHHLTPALERDHLPTGDRPTDPPFPRLPVNPDVLDTITRLTRDIPTIDTHTRHTLGDPHGSGDIPTCLTAAPALHTRLTQHNPQAADLYAWHVLTWHRTLRRAIGLTRPATHLGHPCPLHDDRHHAPELLLRGDEGTLTHTRPGHSEAITWTRGDAIYCPDCGAHWAPPDWPFLGRLLQQREAHT